MSTITVSNLTKTFTSQKWQGFFKPRLVKCFEAVKDLTFTIQEGEFVALLGPNGAGKTTTLKMLTGILYPTSGQATVAGFTPWKKENNFKKSISFVMAQKSQLFLELPVKDTFDFLAEIYEVDRIKYRKRLHELIERFNMSSKLETQGRRLSLGQRMKAELICCFLYEPRVIFLDEPTIGLDVNSAYEVRKFLKETNQSLGTTIILTTHNMDDVEELCARTIVINNGEKIYDAKTEKLRTLFGEDRIIEFILDEATLQDKNTVQQINAYNGVLNGKTLALVVPRSQTTEIITSVMQKLQVKDINIFEQELSKVIAKIYAQ